MEEKQLKETAKKLYEALEKLHNRALYKLCEEDTRETHLPCYLFDEIEECLNNARKAGIFKD